MPITKLKTPMMLALRTTANHLFFFLCKPIINFHNDRAKSSLVRCTFSSFTTHSTISLNGIGFERVYSINTSSSSYHSTCKSFTVRITGFSDSNTSEIVNWSFGSFRSFSFAFIVSIYIWPSTFSTPGIFVPK